MKNADALRAELSTVFKQLQKGEIKQGEASELANIAGKMIASAKVQVEYYALLGEQPCIPFLQSEPDPQK